MLDQIKPAIESARGAALPSGKLGNATAYTLTLWEKLTRFLEYPELELSTNWAEKLDAWGGLGTEELDPHRQSAGWAQGGGNPVRHRNLPAAEDSGPPVPWARFCRD